MTFISTPTIDQVNQATLRELLQRLDPELYLIRIALDETGVDAMIIPHVIRALGNLTLGAGYGKVQIYMQARVVTDVEATEKVKVDREAVGK